MKRLALALVLLTLAVVRSVHGGIPTAGCCACFVPDHGAAVPAFFCVSPTSREEAIAAEQRCDSIPDAQLFCVAQDGTTATDACVAQLAGENIICPASAPALGNRTLAGLAGLLGVLAAVALRRRATGGG